MSIKARSVSAGYIAPRKGINDDQLMNRICKYGTIHWVTSPLCNDWDLFRELKAISEYVWVDFGLLVWITYAESHVGTNFAPSQECWLSNNRAGIKWDSDWNRQYRKGCRLHQFDTVQAFRTSFAKSIKKGYYDKECKTAECITKRWVRWDGKSDWKQGWINRVNLFIFE